LYFAISKLPDFYGFILSDYALIRGFSTISTLKAEARFSASTSDFACMIDFDVYSSFLISF